MVAWISFRVMQMAAGDIGFLSLQRRILENAVDRERAKEAAKKAQSPVEFRSPGSFGRIAS
jgi:hypothetical protein